MRIIITIVGLACLWGLVPSSLNAAEVETEAVAVVETGKEEDKAPVILEPYDMIASQLYYNDKSFKMGGKTYSNGIRLSGSKGMEIAPFLLDEKYSEVSFITGYAGGMSKSNGTLHVFADDEEIATITIEYKKLPKKHTFNVEKVEQLRFEIEALSASYFGIVEITAK